MENKQLTGIERVIAHLQARIYEEIATQEAIPKGLDQCNMLQECISKATIGQLLTFCNLGERWKTLRVLYADNEGTIYLTTANLHGGMDLDGFIHT